MLHYMLHREMALSTCINLHVHVEYVPLFNVKISLLYHLLRVFNWKVELLEKKMSKSIFKKKLGKKV